MRYAPDDITDTMGLGSYVGEVRRGPDGGLYQWNEEVDGLGNIYGWWSRAKSFVKKRAGSLIKRIPGIGPVRKITKRLCRSVPKLKPILSKVPVVAPYYRIGTKVCRALKKVGLAGEEGEIMEAPDGQHYEVMEGIGEFGEPKMMARPVRLIIPAQLSRDQAIGPRRVPSARGPARRRIQATKRRSR